MRPRTRTFGNETKHLRYRSGRCSQMFSPWCSLSRCSLSIRRNIEFGPAGKSGRRKGRSSLLAWIDWLVWAGDAIDTPSPGLDRFLSLAGFPHWPDPLGVARQTPRTREICSPGWAGLGGPGKREFSYWQEMSSDDWQEGMDRHRHRLFPSL